MFNANPQRDVHHNTIADIGVIVPHAIHDLLGTERRYRAYKLWTHSVMMRHQPEAAKLINSPTKIIDIQSEALAVGDHRTVARTQELFSEYSNSASVRTVDGVEVRRYGMDKTHVRIKDGKPVS